jgi:hypothetical protein
MRVGLNVVPMPFGKIKVDSTSLDTKFAFGVFPFFDYLFTPNFFGGLAVQYTFNVAAKDGNGDTAKDLDIMLRLGGGGYVADKLQLYGYASPGYSIVMAPSGRGPDPKGFVVGAHVGAMYDVAPTAFVNLEVGYQFGFQSVSVGGASIDDKVSFLQIGLGGGLRF